MIFEDEIQDMALLMREKNIGRKISLAKNILSYNPQNNLVMEHGISNILVRTNFADVAGASPEFLGQYHQGFKFLQDYFDPVCAIRTRNSQQIVACRLLNMVPLNIPIGLICSRIGQITILKLADCAMSVGYFVLAIRMYDVFLERYRASTKSISVADTVLSLLSVLPPLPEVRAPLKSYVASHAYSPLSGVLQQWLIHAGKAEDGSSIHAG